VTSPRVDETPRIAGGKACVSFFANDRSATRKTDSWETWSLGDGCHVGQVRWNSPWRKYCFFPSSGIALDQDCLRSIAQFVESERPRNTGRAGARFERHQHEPAGTRDGSAEEKGGSTMTQKERVEALLEQAEKHGLPVNYDSGFLVVTPSAAADRGSDDAAEMEQTIIEHLGKCFREVFSLAIARARFNRKDFLGQKVFVPSHQIVGTLADVTASGVVAVSYSGNVNPERTSILNCSVPAEDVLIIMADERLDQASPTSFSWIADENVRRLFERADSIGLSLEHDSGFTLAKWRAIGDVEGGMIREAREARGAMIRRVGNSMREVVARMVAQARGRRGAALVGQRVFVPEFDAFGILSSSAVDGKLTVTYRDKKTQGQRTVFCRGDDLLVILAGAEEAAEASPADKNSDTTWRRLVRRAFGS